MRKLPLAIDGDGVIFDYDGGYINAWERCFGWRPSLTNPGAVLVTQKYAVPELSGDELVEFRNQFDREFWTSLELLPGAEEACKMLAEKYELYMITAIQPEFIEARRENLGGLPFETIIATPTHQDYNRFTGLSPKVDAVNSINAIAFVDDYLPFHRGVDKRVHRALIAPHVNDPAYQSRYNHSEIADTCSAVYNSILDFAHAFLPAKSELHF